MLQKFYIVSNLVLLSKSSISNIEQILSKKGLPASIKQVKVVSGGCINKCYKIEAANTNYFLKVNEAVRYPNMFKIEAKSLWILNETNSIKTPGIIAQFEYQDHQYLLLEWIDNTKVNTQFWKSFAEDIAKLHQCNKDEFGLDFDNYIGSLKQRNTYIESWVDFYIQNRIQPQAEIAFNQNKINKSDLQKFERFYKAIATMFPNEQPALIHGDLWSGNFICNKNMQAVLIDPAIYYANREIEIAFTQLFGGFHPTFYQTYREIYPLENGFEDRIPIYNLYSLLVHLNLFGEHYYEQVMGIVGRF